MGNFKRLRSAGETDGALVGGEAGGQGVVNYFVELFAVFEGVASGFYGIEKFD